mgnify:CR=1 FL=1
MWVVPWSSGSSMNPKCGCLTKASLLLLHLNSLLIQGKGIWHDSGAWVWSILLCWLTNSHVSMYVSLHYICMADNNYNTKASLLIVHLNSLLIQGKGIWHDSGAWVWSILVCCLKAIEYVLGVHCLLHMCAFVYVYFLIYTYVCIYFYIYMYVLMCVYMFVCTLM